MAELKTQGKPFLIVVNSQFPYKDETTQMVNGLQKKYQVPVVAVNCEQLKKEDVALLLEKSYMNFPLPSCSFYSQMGGNAACRQRIEKPDPFPDQSVHEEAFTHS